MKRVATIAAVAALAGCAAGTGLAFHYSASDPVRVEVENPAPHVPKKLDVRMDPDGSPKAIVEPSFGQLMSRVMVTGSDPWLATIDVQREAYGAALLGELERDGRDCEILSSTPYPDYYLFEFTFRCN